jgi:hypothetical protein
MAPQIPAGIFLHLEQAGRARYVTRDGRFYVENTWSISRNREPNWQLTDRKTDRCYRFFVLSELGKKIDELCNGSLAEGRR